MTVILNPADATYLEDRLEAPIGGIAVTAAAMLTAGKDPRQIATWLTVQVGDHDDLWALLLTGQECPACYAVHDETAWARDGMDDGYCSQQCADDAAYMAEQNRARRAPA